MTQAELLDWLEASDAVLDVAVGPRETFPDGVWFIGPEDIDRDLKTAFPDRMGAFATQNVQRLLQRVAARVAGRIARRQSEVLHVSVHGLRHAWFYPVFSELTTLVPIRHLARQYARQAAGRAIAVTVPSAKFTALNGWNENAVEPLYLAYELRRRNVPVFLLFEDAPSALSFQLSDRWLPKGYPLYLRDPKGTTVMSKFAVRKPDLARRAGQITKRTSPGLLSRMRFSRLRKQTCRFDLSLREGPVVAGMRTFALAPMSLDQAFVRLIGPLTAEVAGWYRSKLARCPVKVAHVADHAALESGLLGAEVVRRGGEIRVWPHSANVVHLEAHDMHNIAQVTVAARSTGVYWAKRVGRKNVIVDPKAILPDLPRVQGFAPDAPLNVVVFAGAHFLRRVPLFNCPAHTQSWTKTLDTLTQADVDFVVKHKSVWETRDWIKARATEPDKLRFSNVHANKLALPNMVFLCVSATSTAILEGIARGIPGVIVRDMPIDETPHYDPDFIPCLASGELGAFLDGLKADGAWEDLRERQRTWFERETAPWTE